jgi:hypothetical protein
MITRAPQIIAALAAAALALVPNINPIFALIVVTAFVYRSLMTAQSKPVREDRGGNGINAGNDISGSGDTSKINGGGKP